MKNLLGFASINSLTDRTRRSFRKSRPGCYPPLHGETHTKGFPDAKL
jgi:hypothetical protein